MDSKSFSYEQDTHCHGLDTGSMCSCRRCKEMHHTPSCRVGWMGCYFFGRDVCLEVGWPEAVGGCIDAYGCVSHATRARQYAWRFNIWYEVVWTETRAKSFVCGHTPDACSCDLRGAHATSKAGPGSHGLQCVSMTCSRWMDGCGCMWMLSDQFILALSPALAMWEARHRGSALVLPPT
jgi:hypothetical protein